MNILRKSVLSSIFTITHAGCAQAGTPPKGPEAYIEKAAVKHDC